MTTAQPAAIKTFISYSWSTPAHQAWVLELATRLRTDRVDVKLDTWELAPGRDPIVFMEQMVTDPTVTKVLMICDRVYKEKADGREGGVGKETQILTAEIYEKAAQDKYAALVTELDENGKPYVPAYYHSRQYINFTDTSRQEERYQELLRWIYDKPQFVKPALGTVPSFISDPDEVITATTSKLKQAEHAIKTNSSTAGGAITDFGDALVSEFRSLAPTKGSDQHWDDLVIKSAAAMRPGLRNFVELILAEARYGGTHFERVLRIFEGMGSLMYRPPTVTSWSEDDFDAYKMMCYEGFLSLVAVLIKERRFDLLQMALTHPFLVAGRERGQGSATTTYRVFAQNVVSMTRRKDREKSRQIDLYADLIAETYRMSFPTLPELIQADLLLYIRGAVVTEPSGWEQWWPRMLVYSDRYEPTELFARSESLAFFREWAPKVFGPISVADLVLKIGELNQQDRRSWGGGFMGPSISKMANAEHLGSRT